MTNPDRSELVKLDEAGLEAAVRECARITAPEISDDEYERIKADNSPRYQNTRTEMARAIRAYLASSDSGVNGEPEPVAWRDPKNMDPGQSVTFDRSVMERWPHIYKQPLYTAPPADAWMREAYSALCLPRESQASDNLEGALYDIERLSAQGKPTDDICIRTLKRVLTQIVRAEQALTAPGAPTKSDAEALAATAAERPGTVTSEPEPSTSDSARDDVPLGYERVTDGTTLPGDKFRYSLDNNGVTGKVIGHFRPIKPGPSDPSSTRSDVTVEELVEWCKRNQFFPSWDKARALLDQFEIRKRP